jgi:hypothetical protein
MNAEVRHSLKLLAAAAFAGLLLGMALSGIIAAKFETATADMPDVVDTEYGQGYW